MQIGHVDGAVFAGVVVDGFAHGELVVFLDVEVVVHCILGLIGLLLLGPEFICGVFRLVG